MHPNYPPKEESEVKPKHLNRLETKFLAFLKDVSLRPMTESHRRRGLDGLYHFTLRFQGSRVRLEELNCYGPYSRGSSRFLSLQWGDDALDNAVAEAQRLCPHVSANRIRMALRDLMVKVFHEQAVVEDTGTSPNESTDSEASGELETILDVLDTSNIRQELLETVQRLRSLVIPQTVYVPIEGLDLSGSIRIGEVELHYRSDQSELDQMLGIVEERRGRESIAYARDTLKHATCYATVESAGDDGFARNEAVRKVREALHTLNFCLSSSMHRPSWDKIRISSVVINKSSPTENPDDDLLGIHEDYPGSRPLELSKSKLLDVVSPAYARSFSSQPSQQRSWQEERSIVEQGLEKLLTCFRTSGSIAKRLQRAITWYSKAVDADTPEEQFVNLAIALESLLIGDEGGSINQKLAERVAFLLGDDFESRHHKAAETKQLYGRRCAIVHRGEQIAKEDLSRMDKLVKQVTLAFLVHNFESWPAFQEWIAKQKFGQKVPQ